MSVRCASPQVVIAVLTFRRPDDLAEVLPALVEQARSVQAPGRRVDVLVVDNDPQGGAEPLVRGMADDHTRIGTSVRVRYENETVPGISAARNRALDAARDARLLVFIDDDERPGPGWLADLLATYRSHDCAAVVGPVVSRFVREPDPWVRAGRFFDRRRMPTGTAVEVAATNNLLLDLDVVRRAGLRFDEAFGISGGDDTMFTRQLHAAGGRMVWCDEAVVTDVVPTSRVTRRWVVLRALSSGNSWGTTSVALLRGAGVGQRLRTRVQLTGAGAVRVVGGLARAAAGTLAGSAGHQARGVRTLARGAGMVTGAWGWSYLEYRRR